MSQFESSSQSEKDDQNNDDGSDEDEDEDNSDNEDSNDNETQNSEERKHQKGRRRKLKRKKMSRYFNDENAKVEIKTDRTIKGVHKYKVAITIGEKTITRWFSEKIVNEKASDALEIYNTRPKKIKKKKIRRSIHKQQKHVNENDQQYDTSNENESKILIPQKQNETFNEYNSVFLTSKPEKKQRSYKSSHSEENIHQATDQEQNQTHNAKSDAARKIKQIFGMKNRENANFPDYVVQFTDSNRLERISWKKMHKLYKNSILSFYEQYVTAENLRLVNELPEGLQLEENLNFSPYT